MVTPSQEQRHVSASLRTDNFDEALAWAVRLMDGEFKGSSMPKITLEQVFESDADSPDWHPMWIASVAGSFDVMGYPG